MRIMEQGRRWKNYSLVELSNCGRFRGKKCFSISDGLFSVRWVMGYKHQIGCFPYVLPFFLHIYDSFKSICGKSILMSMETGGKENMGAESFCVTEGEGHRDPVNTNTTSGSRGRGVKYKPRLSKLYNMLLSLRFTSLTSLTMEVVLSMPI